MDADGYTRLSLNRDGRRENCSRQARDIREAAKAAGDSVVRMGKDDSLSAWKRNVKRPDWEETVRRVEAGVCRKIWLWRIDRMMRQPWDLEELIAKGERHGLIIAATNGPPRDLSNYADRHYLRGEVAAACRYSDEISDKSSRAHRAIAEAGHPHAGGPRPFGYQKITGRKMPDPDDPEVMIAAPAILVVDLAEAVIVRDIFRRFLAGEGMAAIAAMLHMTGVPTTTGANWTKQHVKDIVSGGVYAGLRMHHGTVAATGTWEPIVSRAQWAEAGRMLAELSRAAPNAKREYLLSALVVCSCEKRMRIMSGGLKGRPTYQCGAREPYWGCGKVAISAPRADKHVGERLEQVLDDPDAVRPGEDREMQLRAAQAARDAALAKLAEIAEDYGEDRITKEERDRSRKGPAARLEAAEKLLGERRPDVDLVTQGKRWADMLHPQKRATARAYIERVVVLPATMRGGGRWDPRRLDIQWR
ncbi:recombinase family protein [Frankia sp. Mgl5]|uniref:recombinase family protein n=1 Tax=Frankia sp. Mgl5 TaxID=2933793 RepID=UPI00200F08FF|nr:recombinase family protein [Frankia sp. Mgl5]MCK9929988.1 recombinase family protein [Frankia sp. Mgl5]